MSDETLPPLPSPSSISSLDFQFYCLDMSTDTPGAAVEALQATPSGVLVPLTSTARAELVELFKNFTEEIPGSKNPGFFNCHCECLDAAVHVRSWSSYKVFHVVNHRHTTPFRPGVNSTAATLST